MQLLKDSHISMNLVHHRPMGGRVQLEAQIHVQILQQDSFVGILANSRTFHDIVSIAASRTACIKQAKTMI